MPGWIGPAKAQTMEEDFAWAATLEFPDVSGLPFKRMAGKEHGPGYGFVLEEDENEIKLLTLGFNPRTLGKETLTAISDFTLEAYTRTLNKMSSDEILNASSDSLLRRFSDGWPVEFPPRSHTFLCAWILHRQGAAKVAAETYQRARDFSYEDRFEISIRRRAGLTEESFRSTLALQIENTLLSRANLASDWAQLPRIKLLPPYERIQRCFPNSPKAKETKENVATLRLMIAEDRRRPPLTVEEISRLPIEQQAAEWVYQLREAVGSRGSGGFLHLSHRPLEKIGYPAVPALIKALGDERFTRGGARIGHAASLILRNITLEDFGVQVGRGTSTIEWLRKSPAKQAAEVWWQEHLEIGEAAQLVKGVERGDRSSATKAHHLIRRFPELAADAIWKGMQAATNIYARPWLVEKLVKLRNPKAKAYQWREMRESPTLTCRELCAQSLFYQGHRKETIAAMLGEWRNRNRWLAKDSDHNPNFPSLLEFLLTCDDPAVIREIHTEYPKLSPYLRSLILRQLAVYRDVMGAMAPPRYSSPFRSAVFDLLTNGLKDTAIRWTGHSSQSHDWIMSDIAMRALTKWQPDRFKLPAISNTFLRREETRQRFWKLAHQKSRKPAAPLDDPLALAKSVPQTGTPANRVINVIMSEKDQPSSSWSDLVRTLKDTNLTAEKIESIMLSFMNDKKTADRSFCWLAIRHENRRGITVIAESTKDLDQPRNRWKTILDNLVERGPSQLLDGSSYVGEPGAWAENVAHNRSAISEALLSPSNEEIRIRRIILR
ncbi:MAG: hypothetical protein ACKVHO_00955 [Verrucomicrobiia bacterium]